MAAAPAKLLRQVQELVSSQGGEALSDRQLLERFAAGRDEAAFGQLLRRHGPMVLALCRRLLGQEQDAEDAFQAVFLLLARKAAAIRQAQVGGWLYRVAYHLALRARGSAARRRLCEKRGGAMPAADSHSDLTWLEVRQVVDEELQRLPDALRSAVVLCYLEGKTHEEAARRLGWSKGTLRRRLGQGRELLRTRLLARGLAPAAALTASLFADAAPAAVPQALLALTLRCALRTEPVAPAVASLAEGGLEVLGAGKLKTALALVLMLGVLAGAGLWTYCGVPAQSAAPPVAASARAEEPAAPPSPVSPPKGEKQPALEVRGRVLDPDGRPAPGARLYLPQLRPAGQTDATEPEERPRGRADAQGRFRLELPRSAAGHTSDVCVVAAADGLGMSWAELPQEGTLHELTLRLVKDEPVRGRILSTEGKPLAGVRVGILHLTDPSPAQLDHFLSAWKLVWNLAFQLPFRQLSLPQGEPIHGVTTDRDGRFEVRGVGRGRVARVQVWGRGIAQELLCVVTRPGFDPDAYNRAADGRHGRRRLAPQMCGPELTFVAKPGRTIEGVVREAGTDRPVAGVTVVSLAGYLSFVRAVSDARGHYRMAGIPQDKEYRLWLQPGEAGPWLETSAVVPDSEGRLIEANLRVVRGVVVTGRILDRATGKGVPGEVHFAPLPKNKYLARLGGNGDGFSPFGTKADADGRFRLVVIPGRTVLLARTAAVGPKIGDTRVNPYLSADFSPADRKTISKVATLSEDAEGNRFVGTAGGRSEYLNYHNACAVLDLAADAGAVSRDLFVERGKTLTISIQDAEGKPVAGCVAGGLTAYDQDSFTLPEASCTVYALDGHRPRQVAVICHRRKLAGLLTVDGTEKEPPGLRLRPLGRVVGQVLDGQGEPAAGVWVRLSIAGNRAASGVSYQLLTRREPLRTDKNGRFEVDDVFPDVKFQLILVKGHTYLTAERPGGHLDQVKAGETLDLGAFRTTPAGTK